MRDDGDDGGDDGDWRRNPSTRVALQELQYNRRERQKERRKAKGWMKVANQSAGSQHCDGLDWMMDGYRSMGALRMMCTAF